MTDRELVAAARHALTHLEDERELLRNALLPTRHSLSHCAVRSAVLSGLDSLLPASANGAADKPWRFHAILARCDLAGEPHKVVMQSLALSRRQFYRERREALLRLSAAIAHAFERAGTASETIDLRDVAEAYIEALRGAGEHRAVWREALALAAVAKGDVREVDAWMVAAEASRFLAEGDAAAGALEHARDATTICDRHWRAIWIASGEMSLQWVRGDSAGARATLERLERASPPERTLHGKEAILLGMTLAHAAAIELGCGRWEAARSLVGRASRLIEHDATAARLIEHDATAARRQSLLRLSSVLLRLSALLALYEGGDRERSSIDQRAALDAARATGELGSVAIAAVHYADAVGVRDPAEGVRHAEYGLALARLFYPGDRLAELTLVATPVLMAARGADSARQALSAVRRSNLGTRDQLFFDLAGAKIAAGDGKLRTAAECADAVAERLFSLGIDAWAWDARLLAIEADAASGYRPRSRRRLNEVAGGLASARAKERRRAQRLGTLLALPA